MDWGWKYIAYEKYECYNWKAHKHENRAIEYDHIDPLGESTEGNIQLLCKPCNCSKGTKENHLEVV